MIHLSLAERLTLLDGYSPAKTRLTHSGDPLVSLPAPKTWWRYHDPPDFDLLQFLPLGKFNETLLIDPATPAKCPFFFWMKRMASCEKVAFCCIRRRNLGASLLIMNPTCVWVANLAHTRVCETLVQPLLVCWNRYLSWLVLRTFTLRM